MILVFHFVTNLFYNLYRRCIHTKSASLSTFYLINNSNCHPLAQWDAENSIVFDPPVYKQRYERATEILLDDKWRNQITKMIDFGCAEFGLFVFLKNKIQAREILFVDVDESLLSEYLYRLYPLNADYLIRRENLLTVKVFTGSISDPDTKLLNTDAVIALEIVEHLYPDTLDALPYNLFNYINPKLVIVTTPNADFNVLFGKLEKFRHYDHKFEWTREQFESWATNITLRFPQYTVQFDGVGLGPSGSENFGSCSQLALFIRKDIICDNYVEEVTPCICENSHYSNDQDSFCSCNCFNCIPKCSYGVCTYNTCSQKDMSDRIMKEDNYKLLVEVDYPHDTDTRTEDEKILCELKYRLHLFDNNYEFYNSEKGRFEVPINRLAYKSSKFSFTESELITLFLKFNYQIEECLNEETNQVETCVVLEPVMDSGGSSSDTDASGYESDKHNADDPKPPEWDDKDKGNWDSSSDNEQRVSNVKTQLHLEVNSNKKQQAALFDSGYQKSPSGPDESPQSSPAPKQEPIPLEFKSLNSDKPNKLSNILSVFDNFDKINELDALRKEKKYFNFSSNLAHREVMKKICQEIVKHPIAGPSRDPRKYKSSKKAHSSDSDDSVDDVRSITTCILENSLNRIECKEEEPQRGNLIQELIPEELVPQVNQIPEDPVIEPIILVENGDLANNNRDLEGNNYPAENAEDPELQNDNAVDNMDHNNVNIDNNNEIIEEILEEAIAGDVVEENVEVDPLVEVEVAWSSREALFDVNSQIDLLEDFEMESSVATVNGVVFPTSCVSVPDNATVGNEPVLPGEEIGFPNWLLQIFEEGEMGVPEDDLHDEPHFYCQGDGLGVHPSTVAINDDADDEGNESESDSESSSSSSIDFASAENHSVQDLQGHELVVVGQPLSVHQSVAVEAPESEEVFENAEGSESNLVTNSCTE